jgi:hypothetical protein
LWKILEFWVLRTCKYRHHHHHLHLLVVLHSSGFKVRLEMYPLYSVCWYPVQVWRTVFPVKFIARALCRIIYYPSSENISLRIKIRCFRGTNCSAFLCVILHLVISLECARAIDAVSCSSALCRTSHFSFYTEATEVSYVGPIGRLRARRSGSSCFCISPHPSVACVIKTRALIAVEGYHVAIATNIRVTRIRKRLEGNIGKKSGKGSVTVWGSRSKIELSVAVM